jgi:hypothetical protein
MSEQKCNCGEIATETGAHAMNCPLYPSNVETMNEQKYPRVEHLDGDWRVHWSSKLGDFSFMPDERTARMCAAVAEAFALLRRWLDGDMTIENVQELERDTNAPLASVQGEQGEDTR